MANPVVESLVDWNPDASGNDTNLPTSGNSAAIGGNQDLSGNLRLLKSEIRGESLIKSWERWKGLLNTFGTTTIQFLFADATHFAITDDFVSSPRGVATVGRRVRAILSGSVIYGTITGATLFSPNTSVEVVWDSGALDATMTEIQFGLEQVALPEHALTHIVGGRDAFISTNILDSASRRLADDNSVIYKVGNLKLDEAHIAGNIPLRRASDDVISSFNYADSNAYGKRFLDDVDPVLGDLADGDIWYTHD